MDDNMKFVIDPETNLKFLNPNCISIKEAPDDRHPDLMKIDKLDLDDPDLDAKLEENIDRIWGMHPSFFQTAECISRVKDILLSEKYVASSGDRVVDCPICGLRLICHFIRHFEAVHPFIFTRGCIFCKADLPINIANYKTHLMEHHPDEVEKYHEL